MNTNKLWSFLKKSEGLKQSSLTVIGNTLAMGFSAMAIMIFSRNLGPSKFGEFSVGFSIALILNRFNDLGLSFALQKFAPRITDKKQLNKLFSFTTKIKLLGFFAIVILGLILFRPISNLLNFSEPLIILFAFIFSGATTAYEQLQAGLQSLHRFFNSVVANTIQAGAKFIGAIVIFFLGSNSSLIILSYYLLTPAIPLILLKKMMPDWFLLKLNDNFSKERQLLKTMAKHSSVANISAGLIENIDILFVQGYLSSYETGLLGGVSRIALLFSLVAYSLGTVLNPRVARYQEKKHIQKFILKALIIAGLSILGFLASLPFSKWLIFFSIGPAYLNGISILNILLAASFLTIAVMPFIALFFSFEANWYFSLSGILQLILIVGGNLIFVPIYGLQAAAWTRLVTRLVLFIFTFTLAIYLYYKNYVFKKS